MAIFDFFSKRQKRINGENNDVLTYDEIPKKLRVQIVHIIHDAIGEDRHGYSNAEEAYRFLHESICREFGVFRLMDDYEVRDKYQVSNYLLSTVKNDDVLDITEFVFQYIERCIKPEYRNYANGVDIQLRPDEAVNDLNTRFKESGIGYAFEGGMLIRLDSTYMHREVTKHVISLFQNSEFIGANEEYLNAHEHYKHGRNKECLTECLKAFESTMKTICTLKGWAFNQNDPAKKLIQVCFQNQLVPTYTQNQFTALQNLLESGIPTIRNKLGGHGQGHIPQKVDDEMTRYGLNLTGANIIFLIEQSGIK